MSEDSNPPPTRPRHLSVEVDESTKSKPPPKRFSLNLVGGPNGSGPNADAQTTDQNSAASIGSQLSNLSLDSSFEVSANSTLHIKGFEIKDSGISRAPLSAAVGGRARGRSDSGNGQPIVTSHRGSITSSPLPPILSCPSSSSSSSSSSFSSSSSSSSSSATSSSHSPSLSGTSISPSSPDGDYLIHAADLSILGSVGKGACGVVRKALHIPTCQIVALKNVSIYDRDKRKQLVSELIALSTLNSPSIIGFSGAFFADGVTSLVLEYMNRNSLLNVLKQYGPFDEMMMAHVARQAFQGLEALHENFHIHRDIKPGNILINRNCDVKIADFGVLTALEGTSALASTFVGTTIFMAPERVTNESYSYASDIWAMGVSLYYLAVGRLPYSADGGYFGIMRSITESPSPSLPHDRHYSDSLRDLIHCCCHKEANKRWTANQLLEHPFIVGEQERWEKAKQKVEGGKLQELMKGPNEEDEKDLAAIVEVLMERVYNSAGSYKRSLFDLSRFQRIAEQLGMPMEQVKKAVETSYKQKFS